MAEIELPQLNDRDLKQWIFTKLREIDQTKKEISKKLADDYKDRFWRQKAIHKDRCLSAEQRKYRKELVNCRRRLGEQKEISNIIIDKTDNFFVEAARNILDINTFMRIENLASHYATEKSEETE